MAKKTKKIKPTSKLHMLRDSDSHSAIVSSLKRSFSRSPIVVSFLKKHRREEIWFKKDGSKALKPHVFYKCAVCNKEFNSTKIQVDHIESVVPLNIPSKHLSYDTLILRLHCDESNLQILCKEDHAIKSSKENETRKAWLCKTKYIVYETTNRVNRKKYIGVHKCDDYDDFYLGSGLALREALKKYGADAFYRNILEVYDNAEDAYNKETELVTSEDAAITHPSSKKPLIHLNTYKRYDSVETAANELSLNYKSLCNSLIELSEHGYYSFNGDHFLYVEDFNPNTSYKMSIYKIRCVESNKVFNSSIDAAIFVKHKNPIHGAIAINKAIREGIKMYKFHWERVTETIPLPIIDSLYK